MLTLASCSKFIILSRYANFFLTVSDLQDISRRRLFTPVPPPLNPPGGLGGEVQAWTDVFNFKFTVDNFTRFVETFDPNKYKFGEINIHGRVNMQDITIETYDQKKLIKLGHLIKSFEAANSFYFEENKENDLKLIEKVIIKYYWWKDDQFEEIINILNKK